MFSKLMATNPNKKLINLPSQVWQALGIDAERCKRSVTKQIEAILESYFEIADIEVKKDAIAHAYEKNNFTDEVRELTREEIQKQLFPKKADVLNIKTPTGEKVKAVKPKTKKENAA